MMWPLDNCSTDIFIDYIASIPNHMPGFSPHASARVQKAFERKPRQEGRHIFFDELLRGIAEPETILDIGKDGRPYRKALDDWRHKRECAEAFMNQAVRDQTGSDDQVAELGRLMARPGIYAMMTARGWPMPILELGWPREFLGHVNPKVACILAATRKVRPSMAERLSHVARAEAKMKEKADMNTANHPKNPDEFEDIPDRILDAVAAQADGLVPGHPTLHPFGPALIIAARSEILSRVNHTMVSVNLCRVHLNSLIKIADRLNPGIVEHKFKCREIDVIMHGEFNLGKSTLIAYRDDAIKTLTWLKACRVIIESQSKEDLENLYSTIYMHEVCDFRLMGYIQDALDPLPRKAKADLNQATSSVVHSQKIQKQKCVHDFVFRPCKNIDLTILTSLLVADGDLWNRHCLGRSNQAPILNISQNEQDSLWLGATPNGPLGFQDHWRQAVRRILLEEEKSWTKSDYDILMTELAHGRAGRHVQDFVKRKVDLAWKKPLAQIAC